MKKETRRAKLMELWDDDEEVVSALKEEIPKSVLEQYEADENSREAEALLIFMRCPEYFVASNCKRCEKPFVHTYGAVWYCSNRCRRKDLEDEGINWDVTKSPQERWRPRYVDELRPRVNDKGKQVESQEDFLKRQSRHQSYYPVPLVVPSEAVEILSKMLISQGVLQQFSDNGHQPQSEVVPQ